MSDGSILEFRFTEYPDYADAPTGNLVEFALQMKVPSHFGDDAGTCEAAEWGYQLVNVPDAGLAGFEDFGTGGCEGRILDDGTWDNSDCGGFFNLNGGFYNCYFGYMDNASAMWGGLSSVGFWYGSGADRRYYDTGGQSDFKPLYFVVPR